MTFLIRAWSQLWSLVHARNGALTSRAITHVKSVGNFPNQHVDTSNTSSLSGENLQKPSGRENRLTELWQRFERKQSEQRPIWPEQLLDIAKQIAKGHRQYLVAMRPNEMPVSYASRIQRLEADYPVVSYAAQNERAFEVGKECLRVLEGIEPSTEGVVSESIPRFYALR